LTQDWYHVLVDAGDVSPLAVIKAIQDAVAWYPIFACAYEKP
jgi:hypothetical protein